MMQINDQIVENIQKVLNGIADECHDIEPYLEKAEVISQGLEHISSAIMLIEKYSKDLEESFVVLSDLCFIFG